MRSNRLDTIDLMDAFGLQLLVVGPLQIELSLRMRRRALLP